MLTPAVNKFDCSVSVITPENIEFQYALAGPFQRLPAFLFDIMVRVAVMLVATLVVAIAFSFVSLGLYAGLITYFLLYFLLSWFYGAFCESRFNGRTLGKMIFRLRVISTDGRPINAMQAVLRNLLRLADMGALLSLQIFGEELPPAFVIPTFSIGLATMMFTRHYQRLGDLVAGTIVISEHSQRSPWNLQPDDVRAYGLAELIPASFAISSSLAQTVGMYMENRQRLFPGRRAEVAKHLAVPLIERFELLPDTSPDLLMCALYVRIFLSDEQRARGLEEMRRRSTATPRPLAVDAIATLPQSPPVATPATITAEPDTVPSATPTQPSEQSHG